MKASPLPSIIAISIVVLACYEGSLTDAVGTVGAIEVLVSTSGPDQDADGYTVTAIASGPDRLALVPTNGKVTVTGTRPGAVRLVLHGLAHNCAVVGLNSRMLTVMAGDTVTANFDVACVTSGTLKITTTTTGADTDVDGYRLSNTDAHVTGSVVDPPYTFGFGTALPPNGTTVVQSLRPGSYRLDIREVAPNCNTPDGPSITVTIVAGVETALTLPFTCAQAEQIAFVRGAGREEWESQSIANTDIYVVKMNGTAVVRLTSEPGADLNPAWSPDGQKIAFASDRDGNREIYVMNADGTAPVRLTHAGARDYSPGFSPDGKRIVFVSERDGNAEIYLMNADGTNVTRLTSNPAPDTDPSFAPNGSTIAFVRGNLGIYLMNTDGSSETRVTSSREHAQPAWSPDSKTLAFMRDGREIWLMNPDGSFLRQVLSWNYSRGNPDWSPDGRSLAFDDRDCWDSGPCPRGVIIATIAGEYGVMIGDASEPAWRPR